MNRTRLTMVCLCLMSSAAAFGQRVYDPTPPLGVLWVWLAFSEAPAAVPAVIHSDGWSLA